MSFSSQKINLLTPNIGGSALRPKSNTLLKVFAVIIIASALGLILYPLAGLFGYYLKNISVPVIPPQAPQIIPLNADEDTEDTNTNQAPAETQKPAQNQASQTTTVTKTQPAPAPTQTPKPTVKTAVNKIVIPKIGVDMKIVEGADVSALYKGAWHLPGTSTPNLGGNTVISAHRYLYRPPSTRTFYLLDKMAVGDIVKVTWAGIEYTYQVSEVKIIEPEQVEILQNTSESIITLFTCTPLFTSEKRLVVIADLVI